MDVIQFQPHPQKPNPFSLFKDMTPLSPTFYPLHVHGWWVWEKVIWEIIMHMTPNNPKAMKKHMGFHCRISSDWDQVLPLVDMHHESCIISCLTSLPHQDHFFCLPHLSLPIWIVLSFPHQIIYLLPLVIRSIDYCPHHNDI